MKKNLVILAALIALAGAYTLYADRFAQPAAQSPAAERAAPQAAAPAPDFTFTDTNGKKHKLSDFRGKTVILNFWASWCAPCVIEFPAMLDLARQTREEAVFLFLSADIKPEDIGRFMQKHGRNLPMPNVYIAWDENTDISRGLYQTYRLPETYLIDSSGKMTEKIVGADIDWAGEDMRRKVVSLSGR